MAVQQAQLQLSADDLQTVDTFTQSQGISLETLYASSWLHTLSVYSAGTDVAAAVVRDGGRIYSLGSVIEGTMTLPEVVAGLKMSDSEEFNIKQDNESSTNAFPNDFHHYGTMIGVSDDDASQAACDAIVKRFVAKAGGLIRACVTVSKQGQLTLHCVPDSTPAHSPEALLDTYAALVRRSASGDSTTRLLDLDVLGPLNRSILDGWTKTDFTRLDRCVHDLVEEYAAAHPDKDAVVAMEGRGFTYGELSTISTGMAKRLVDLGIRKGDVVPTLMDKSQFAILSAMAIMKAGAAYVGFSAESPVNFLRQCARIADVKVICTTPERKSLVEQVGCPPLVVDDDLIASFQEAPSAAALPEVYPSDLVYLVFTSGSTGTPKAVMTEHGPYSGCALAQMKHRLVNDTRRVLQFSSYNFDAINGEIFTPLVVGATICIPTEYSRMNCLSKAINELEVNYMGLPPTLAKILDPKTVPGLKVFTMAGEPIGRALVEQWTSAPGLDVINVYGPSEACMDFSANIYTRHSKQENNIGRAFDDICAGHVVNADNHNQLLPIGAHGELLIQGSTLGRGYLKEPEKTAKAYISNPTWLSPATSPDYRRLYKTGDMVQQKADQTFLTYARIDKMVKLNGQRMELGEIEYNTAKLLRENCKVAVELVQLPWRHEAESKLLVAFYSSKAGWHSGSPEDLVDTDAEPCDAEDLMKRLLDDLKPIAIPKAFIPLRLMPATLQGKLDRKILLALGSQLDQETFSRYAGDIGTGEPVRTEAERVVQGLFAQALGLKAEQVARDSDFFWLGGDSIRAMKLIAFAQRQGLHLSVPDVLQNPKLHAIAALVDEAAGRDTAQYAAFDAIRGEPDRDGLLAALAAASGESVAAIEDVAPATDLQAACLAWATLQRRGAINWLVCDFAAPAGEDPQRVAALCRFLARRHGILRTGFAAHRRRLFQVVSAVFRPPVSVYHDAGDVRAATDEIVALDRRRAVDIGQPQTAFVLLSPGYRTRRLLVRLSHAQYDGQSLRVLSRDMRAFLQAKTAPLASHGTFAGYLHLARAMETTPGRAYWRSLLDGARMTAVVERRAPAVYLEPASRAVVETVATQLLKARQPLSKATSVKTAWALALADLTRTDDVVFGSTVWGRNAPVPFADDVLGSTLSHIPTRARVGAAKRYIDLMEALQAQHLESMRFESLGANAIVEACTDWARSTRLSSLLVFQGLEMEADTAPDTGVVSISEIVDPADRTDLHLHVEPQGDATKVILRFCEAKIPAHVADAVMAKFLHYLEQATQSSDSPIKMDSHDASSSSAPTLPVVYDGSGSGSNGVAAADQHSHTNGSTNNGNGPGPVSVEKHGGHAASSVETAWAKVLNLGAVDVEQHRKSGMSFLDIWGGVISAAALAQEYRNAGFAVYTEDMLRNQTMESQMKLLA